MLDKYWKKLDKRASGTIWLFIVDYLHLNISMKDVA